MHFNHLDFEIANEVLTSYSMSLPLNSEAIIGGLTLAFACNVAARIVLATLVSLFRAKPINKFFYRP